MRQIYNTLKAKWSEYLLEILVITIGILGAFALNSWNENRKLRQKEAGLIKEINFEFKENRRQLESVINGQKNSLKSTNWLIEEWPFTEKTDNDSLKYHFLNSLSTWTFNSAQSNLNTIINSGSFDIIQNDSLRQILVQWEYVLNDYKEEENRNMEFFNNEYIPFFQRHIDFKKFLRFNELKYSDFDSSVETSNIFMIRYLTLFNTVHNNENEQQKVMTMIDSIIALTELK